MSRLGFHRRMVVSLLALGAMWPSAASAERMTDRPSWVATWALPLNVPGTTAFSGQTVRVVLHPSFGGPRVRLHLSNATGTSPLTLQDVQIARPAAGAGEEAGSSVGVTFGGRPTVTIPPGGQVVSDPVGFSVAALHDIAVSVYVPGTVQPTTGDGELATYYTALGDHGDDTAPGAFGPIGSNGSFFVTGVDVFAPNDGLVVAIGDSITAGYNAGGQGWPLWLAQRFVDLAANGGPRLAIVNMGISGNKLTQDGTAISGGGYATLHRLQRDVLDQPGLRTVLLMEGINDLGGLGGLPVPADQVESALATIISRVNAAGADILVSPLTPAGDLGSPVLAGPGYSTPMGVRERHSVADWIRRQSGAYAAGFDFQQTVSDPTDPDRLLSAFDSGDHLHPNVTGQQTMAEHIDLATISSLPRRSSRGRP